MSLIKFCLASFFVLTGGMLSPNVDALHAQQPETADLKPRVNSQIGAGKIGAGPIVASDDHAIAVFAEDLDIAAETSGVVKTLLVSEGDLIGKDQVMGVLDSQRAQLEFELATLQLEFAEEKTRNDVDTAFARANIDIAEKKVRRGNNTSGAIAEAEMDQFKFEKTRGELALQQATQDKVLSILEAKTAAAQKNLAEHDLHRHQIKAPVDGVIVELYQRPGEFLQAGQPLLRMVKNDVMRISAAIDADQAALIERGFPVQFQAKSDLTDRPVFRGKVIFVSPETFGEVRTVKILAEVEVPKRNLKAKTDGVLEIFQPVENK